MKRLSNINLSFLVVAACNTQDVHIRCSTALSSAIRSEKQIWKMKPQMNMDVDYLALGQERNSLV